MVVTSSRQEAVRYQLAMLAYVREKSYGDVHPLVAFSGTVLPDVVIPEEVSENSRLLNAGLSGRDLAEAFDTPDFNVLIAANKFQTGFDQPKLCAMYVDKKLQGVDCVQTLSRLNRTFPGKETFILDFFNDPQGILEAFLPYYNKAELADVSDPQVVYDLQKKLDEEQIYHRDEVERFAEAFFDPKAATAKLSYYCSPAKERFAGRFKAAEEAKRHARAMRAIAERNGDKVGVQNAEHAEKEAGEAADLLELFKKNLRSFVRVYEFLSQIIDYDDVELEQLNVYASHLYPLLRASRLEEDDVDVSELSLTHYRLTKQAEFRPRLDEETGEYTLKPISEVGSGKPFDPEKKRLSEIIEALNELFGAQVGDDDQLHFFNGVADRVCRDSEVMAQVNNHTPERVMHGLFPRRVVDAVLDSMTDHEKLAMEVLDDESKSRDFTWLMLKVLAGAGPAPGPGRVA